MLQEQQTIDLAQFTPEQLKQIEEQLDKKKKAEAEEHAKKRKGYESDREKMINFLGHHALQTLSALTWLKGEAMNRLPAFRGRMLEYGDLRNGEHNKGSFEVKNDRFKIVFASQINKRFDERAQLGEAKLKAFLTTMVKKRDADIYELVTSLLERNDKTGDYDIDLINRLYKLENRFDHPDWKEAIKLFKEAYNPVGTAQYIRFFRKLENGSWEAIVLDFAKAKSNGTQQNEATKEP